MSLARLLFLVLGAALTGGVLAACDDDSSEQDLAPKSQALEPAQEETKLARKFLVDRASSKVEFLMEAPLENIHGKAPSSMRGDFTVDFNDVTRSNGLVKVDLMKLELFQSKREGKGDEFGEEKKNETQNEHMRTWFQISDDAPEDVREDNRWVEYKITKIENVSKKNVLAMEGDERTITADVTGDFRLHGRKTTKAAKVEISFVFEEDTPVSMKVETVEPMAVGLEEHDVRPRSAFDKLAQKTLAALGQKVAEAAPVSFEFEAKAQDT